jgi:oligopeptide/dipeptide ABC transporter ATP-binding protein
MAVQSTRELFEAPAHPYAAALISAMPNNDRRAQRLNAVPGRPLSSLDVTTGCPFRTRCQYAIDECAEIEPTLIELEPGTKTECIRAEDIRDDLARSVHDA